MQYYRLGKEKKTVHTESKLSVMHTDGYGDEPRNASVPCI
jgi:hypothetical protein